MSASIFTLNEDCLTLLLGFLKLQDLINLDLCATGDKVHCIEGSSYLNSLQHLENYNLNDSKRPIDDWERECVLLGWSPQSVLWGCRKNLCCLLSARGFMLGISNRRVEGALGVEEDKITEMEKRTRDRLRARMELALGAIGTKCAKTIMVQLQGSAITDRGVTSLLASKVPINCVSFLYCRSITDAALVAVSEHLGDCLEELSIADCPVSDAGLIQVITGCPKISSLSLSFREFIHDDPAKVRRFPSPAFRITDATLFAVAQSLPDLSILYCHCQGFYRLDREDYIPSDAFEAIVKACGLLSTLEIEGVATDDEFLVALGNSCPYLSEFSFDGNGDTEVTDVGITALAEGCPDLTRLDANYSTDVSDAGMTSLVNHCPKLENLTVPSTTTDDGLQIVLTSCKSLEALKLRDCFALTVSSARTLADHGENLTELELCDILWLDDASLLTIAAGCTSLNAIDLFSFDVNLPVRVTNEGLLAAAQACKKSTLYFGLRGTHVTQEGIDELARACPAVHCRFI